MDKFDCFKRNTKDDFKSILKYVNGENFSSDLSNEYSFFGRKYDRSVWLTDAEHFFRMARRDIKFLEQATLTTDSSSPIEKYSQIRSHISDLMLASRNIVLEYKNCIEYREIVKNIHNKDLFLYVTKIINLPDYVLFGFDKSPAQDYLHLYLDLNWININLEYIIEDNSVVQLKKFEENLHMILLDLIYVGVKRFKRNSNIENTPYLCSCFKELWLKLQILVGNLNEQGFCKNFWCYFNLALREVVDCRNPDGEEPVACLWLLSHIAKLQGFENSDDYIGNTNRLVVPNFELAEECLRFVLNSNGDEKYMRKTLHLITILQTDLWSNEPTIDLLQLLWEHFYKRIQTNFAITSDNSFFVNTSQKFCNFQEYAQSIYSDRDNSNSYELFLYLLNSFLRKHPTCWSKFKGRIYSKLSPTKLATFNDVGLKNLTILFITLATSVNLNELTEKLLNLLYKLPDEQTMYNGVVWSAHMSVINLYVKEGKSIQTIVKPVLKLIEQVCPNRNKEQLMKIFIDGVIVFIDSITLFDCCEHKLFASNWLEKYLRWCPYNELCSFLELLIKLIEKLKVIGVVEEWQNVIYKYIAPSVIQLSKRIDCPLQVADFAATVVSMDPQKNTYIIEQLILDVRIEIVEIFLRKLFTQVDFEQLSAHQKIIIQAWLRLILLSLNQSTLYDLTQQISQFSQWKALGQFDVYENDDPFYIVIKLVGSKFRDAKNMQEVLGIKKWCETYFGQMHRWIEPVLGQKDKVDSKVVLRIYTCGALLFINCAPALYVQTFHESVFQNLVTTLLLPSDLLFGRKPENSVLSALRVTWHLYVRGILKIDYKNNSNIDSILRDLVIKYMRYFNQSNSPIIRCMDPEFKDEDTALILDKILLYEIARVGTIHKLALETLNVIYEMIVAKSDCDTGKLRVFIEKAVPVLLEQIMFNDRFPNSKNRTIQILEKIKNCKNYATIRPNIKNAIISAIDKYFAFYSKNVFDLLQMLLKVMKTEVQELENYLKEAVFKVERMRGVGYDNTLRKGLQEIQQLMQKQLNH